MPGPLRNKDDTSRFRQEANLTVAEVEDAVYDCMETETENYQLIDSEVWTSLSKAMERLKQKSAMKWRQRRGF